jgi:amino acid adenylation domain-containing protein
MVRESADPNESLPACFDRVAALHPRRAALVADGRQWSYAQLNATANRLAHALISHGSAPGDRIAILMQHDAPAIAAMVAVLKAGRVVVVLNPPHPPARLRELIEDSEPSLIVTDASLRNLATEIAGLRCAVVPFETHSAEGPDHNPSIEVLPHRLARLAYTSGSSGRPKGVMQTHRQIRRNVINATESMALSASDRMALLGSLSGGQGVNLTWCALLNGMALCPFPIMVKGVTGLADWMTSRGITVFATTASIFRNFMETLAPDFRFAGIRVVRLGGEPATSEDFKLFQRHFSRDCWFVHTLTSTEASNVAWSRQLSGEMVPEGRLPIGTVSEGQEVLLLDEDEKPVAPGEVGEIVVRSRYVAAGYWRNPELTAERFSADLDGAGTRRVRTGDLGRINSAGMLEFCGRRDDRLKVRGHRIEPSEIADALNRLQGIERAVIEAVPRAGREPLLVGFVIVRGDRCWTQADLRRALRGTLPDHMVPSEFVFLQNFPLTPGGKIDREKLRQSFRQRRRLQPGEQPMSKTETLLVGIWADVLEISDIGRRSDFFALGGDSLMAAVIAARVHADTGVELNLQMFVERPTLAELASCIDELSVRPQAQIGPPLVAVSRKEPLPLSSFQLRAWTGSQTPERLAAYIDADCRIIHGPLDRDVFCDCLSYIVRRHEILRTTFPIVDGRPVQLIHPPTQVAVEFVDLTDRPNVLEETQRLLELRRRDAIDLQRGPLFRHCLIRTRQNEHFWLRVTHHIITDAWSSDLQMRELGLVYEAKSRGHAPPLPDREPLQYGDFVVWQQRVLNPASATYQATVQWWKDHLAGAPQVFAPPLKRAEPLTGLDPADGCLRRNISPAASMRLDDIGRKHGATPFAVRLAAFVAYLAEATRQSDVVLGTYVTNRTNVALQNMVGLFVNLATLRFVHDSRWNFHQLVSKVRDEVAAAAGQSGIPYDELRAELERLGIIPPYIQIIFGTTRRTVSRNIAGLTVKKFDRRMTGMPWGFTVSVVENEEVCEIEVKFDACVYDPSRVDAFIAGFNGFLDAVSCRPDLSLSRVAAGR